MAWENLSAEIEAEFESAQQANLDDKTEREERAWARHVANVRRLSLRRYRRNAKKINEARNARRIEDDVFAAADRERKRAWWKERAVKLNTERNDRRKNDPEWAAAQRERDREYQKRKRAERRAAKASS